MDTNYLANGQPNEGQIEAWAEEFNRRGCLFLRNILPPDWTATLRADLDHVLREKSQRLEQQESTRPPGPPPVSKPAPPICAFSIWSR